MLQSASSCYLPARGVNLSTWTANSRYLHCLNIKQSQSESNVKDVEEFVACEQTDLDCQHYCLRLWCDSRRRRLVRLDVAITFHSYVTSVTSSHSIADPSQGFVVWGENEKKSIQGISHAWLHTFFLSARLFPDVTRSNNSYVQFVPGLDDETAIIGQFRVVWERAWRERRRAIGWGLMSAD
ncbi:hypothetical protein BaRGS_00001485 [Batillaria attramentaria]|uniref:Uncharacterized protein n=1 Tax=Batillaria attramentaria TaxID=370345 RepID=A0ABD0M753_9CAEN